MQDDDEYQQHMNIPWNQLISGKNSITDASLTVKTALISRIGAMMLSCGTGAWRVRESMNTIAKDLNICCSADIGLVSLEITCYENNESHTQAIALPSTGLNTTKLHQLESLVKNFQTYLQYSPTKINRILSRIQAKHKHYSTFEMALAAGLGCFSFIFLLGGGLKDMLCCFVAAAAGKYVNQSMNFKRLTSLLGIAIGVATSCLVYFLTINFLQFILHTSALQTESGYIGSILFVIPGFPFITSILDLAKSDMRSGMERLTYSLMIITVATLVGWLIALILNLHPENFVKIPLNIWQMLICRIITSFLGVFGFSIMFNSYPKMAIIAGIIGAIANTLRLELINFTFIPSGAAAFIGALTAGLLASIVQKKIGYPRITITVPSIVIMIPGFYLYRSIYNIGNLTIHNGATWFIQAALISIFLPFGLIVARFLTDSKWKHTN